MVTKSSTFWKHLRLSSGKVRRPIEILQTFFGPFTEICGLEKKSKTERGHLWCSEFSHKNVSLFQKVERGTSFLWNCFVFHVKGFGCGQNKVLCTYRKRAPCTKSGPLRVRLTKNYTL